jgi:signal transduction histidine kinase
VINVLDNAIKHAPRGSSVTLRMVRSAGRQGFAVVDHGPGVADRDKAKIFERYVRGSDGNGKGFGLGLFVARQQLEGVAGTIEVTDTPGGGATFTCTLKEEGSWPAS